MDLQVFYKTTGQNYRQIISFKNVEVCDVMENSQRHPQMATMYRWTNATFPGYCHPCPYNVSFKKKLTQYTFLTFKSLQVINGTLPSIHEWNRVKNWPKLPNGNFRSTFRYYDETDANIGTVVIFYENKYADGRYEH